MLDAPHVEVLVVGAGLSGICAAWRLRRHLPDTTIAVLEARTSLGGTWDLFRYPGVRSDSDMFTYAYPFRPWRGPQSLADGAAILTYLRQTAADAGIEGLIRYGTRVVAASWCSRQARWTVDVESADGAAAQYTCSFLHLCTGYYDYAHGYQPDFPDLERFEGVVVHPQSWPADLDHRGKQVVVIGSGATAVTLVPALAGRAARVTMLQRSPGYVLALSGTDRVAGALRRLLPSRAASSVLRARNVTIGQAFYQLCRRRPETAKGLLRRGLRRYVDDAVIEESFTPGYDPWDQRLCVVPDGDLLRALADGTAEVVTDRIDAFVPQGIALASGRVLAADVVVCATGLELQAFGGAHLVVDGEPVEPGSRLAYRGMMLDGVPNLSFCMGYTNASWTLRADLVSRYLCRLLRHLYRERIAAVTPRAPATGSRRPLLGLTSGYVRRGAHRFPQQGEHAPWTVGQNYLLDRWTFARADLTAGLDLTPAAPR